VDTLPRCFSGVQDYPAFAQRLYDRGVDEETIRNIFWNNAIGVMERAVCNHQK
jgi:microsomal dipeptidase-like Zn-dependent dipeptidase